MRGCTALTIPDVVATMIDTGYNGSIKTRQRLGNVSQVVRCCDSCALIPPSFAGGLLAFATPNLPFHQSKRVIDCDNDEMKKVWHVT